MAHKPRLDLDGFHHIIDRGVAHSDIYRCDEDKGKFLKILCKACRTYEVIIHACCLMGNHYHLLIETTAQNLSLFMRQVNANYAIYRNRTILLAIEDGYTQGEIARYLGLSTAMVSKIFRVPLKIRFTRCDK